MNQQKLVAEHETALSNWRAEEKMALQLIKTAGQLRFDKGVDLIIFRKDIYDSRPSEVLNNLLLSKNYTDSSISISDTLEIARSIAGLEKLQPSKIDVGRMALEWVEEGRSRDAASFVGTTLKAFTGSNGHSFESRDVVLYGFGRIGRLIARRIISTTGRGDQLQLRAIVIRSKMKDLKEEMEKRAALLMDDSIHGEFQGRVEIDYENETLIINGNRVKMIFADRPTEVDYTAYGIKNALMIDNTGVWRDEESLSQHLRPGISKVILTAPGKNIPNIVYGVNQGELDRNDHDIVSAASCTTNAIVPVIKVMEDEFGIDHGHIETIHAYTSDQNLLDNFHKKPRRGRAAAINMVLTTTGAAAAVSKVLPHLKGLLTGNAVRVPTPDVSLAIMNLHLKRATSIEEVNERIKKASFRGSMVEQIHYSTSTEFVSSHAIGSTTTSIFDAPSTIVSQDGKSATIYAWYDNEYGYCCQVVRLAKYVARVRRKTYY